MNVENIKKVRDVIAALPPERLYMLRYLSEGRAYSEVRWTAGRLNQDCGTCGCIAGWAAATLKPSLRYGGVEAGAGALLGLNGEDAEALFMPKDVDLPWSRITPAHAVAVLNHLLATGKVDWSIIAEPVAS